MLPELIIYPGVIFIVFLGLLYSGIFRKICARMQNRVGPPILQSFYDAIKLMELLERLVQEGNSILIIEHDPEILSYCDYLIELGPEGGPKGGEVITKGTPEEIKNNKNSKTGPYLN